MYLINVNTLELERFDTNAPPYAILSHRWREGEVSFGEFQDPDKRKSKAGFSKILETCAHARKDSLGYAWVDTCCIDKSSSAELSEAINSMFKWYQRSRVCYAFLDDVSGKRKGRLLKKSEWFKRGWTLQELIAPSRLKFYKRKGPQMEWELLGDRSEFRSVIWEMTGIPEDAFGGEYTPRSYTIFQKMSWASERITTREEDAAYCLMGLFDVNMPLLYGEGKKAFLRLQEEIVRNVDDDTIFAWQEPDAMEKAVRLRGVFAPSPASFGPPASFSRLTDMAHNIQLEINSKGLRTNVIVCPTRKMLEEMGVSYPDSGSHILLPLKVFRHSDKKETRKAILLRWLADRTYCRILCDRLFTVDSAHVSRDTTVFVSKSDDDVSAYWGNIARRDFAFQLPDKGIRFLQQFPAGLGEYSPTRSAFYVDWMEDDPRNPDTMGLVFAFHLEGTGKLLLVAIEICKSSSKVERPRHRMVAEIVPTESMGEEFASGLSAAQDRLLSRDNSASLGDGSGSPTKRLLTRDFEFYDTDNISTTRLRVSLVGDFNQRLFCLWVLRIAILG